jgi:hypothetical protein
MKKQEEDLRFINWLRAFERSVGSINTIITDSQQREELHDQQNALVKKLHQLYWSGEIRFDAKCLDSSKLKVA